MVFFVTAKIDNNKNNNSDQAINKVLDNLNYFLDNFFQGEKQDLNLFKPLIETISVKCWQERHCQQTDCPAFKNPLGRCWLTPGTLLCCSKVKGAVKDVYVNKFNTCKTCDIFKKSIQQNPLAEINEKLLIIIHELYHKQSELNQWATTDFLTGLYNRRYFDLFIHSEIEKVKRNNYQLFVTLIDINDFKKVNDQFGHLTGDNILKECAKILTAVTRKSDLLIRYGGDEFLVVSYGSHTHDHTADQLIARIIQEVDKWNKEKHYPNVLLSLSFGYSSLSHSDHFDKIIAEADRNMYQYKKQLKKQL